MSIMKWFFLLKVSLIRHRHHEPVASQLLAGVCGVVVPVVAQRLEPRLQRPEDSDVEWLNHVRRVRGEEPEFNPHLLHHQLLLRC